MNDPSSPQAPTPQAPPNEAPEDLNAMDDQNPERLKKALIIAGQNIAELNDKGAKVTAALNMALILIDQLLDELRIAGLKPPGTVVVAKVRLDQEMRALFGGGEKA